MPGYAGWMRVTNGWKRTARGGAAVAATLALGGCMMMSHAERPAESEFGMGPRRSAGGVYEASIETAEPLRVRRMQSVKLNVRAAGTPVEGAAIVVDGGMPQHGHGLPTTPRVTRPLGGGAYQVEGVKFNMGGWWELRFRITSAAGTDSVTFNLDL
ncbi:MAG TPA: FixH family protein [Longimicrobium sp.]|nr:FixH family protein [Longimicrobium sp.]